MLLIDHVVWTVRFSAVPEAGLWFKSAYGELRFLAWPELHPSSMELRACSECVLLQLWAAATTRP